MKLNNIGSGRYPLKGYKNIDIDFTCYPDECYDIKTGLAEVNNSIDEILISHTLMYLTTDKVKKFLKECLRVLKDDGIIRITEDNRNVKLRNEVQQEQYGRGVLFNRLEMMELLRKAGFVEIKESEPFKETKQHLELPKNYSLASGKPAVYFLTAVKKERGRAPIVFLGLDDFGETNSQLDLLWRLRGYFDDFKVNLFSIPNDCLNLNFLRYIDSLKWINICLHGYYHDHYEKIDETTLNILTNKKSNYFNKVYKAPYWELSNVMKNRLLKLGFLIVEDNFVNWEIDVKPPKKTLIHGTGHIYQHDYKSVNGNIGSSLFHHYKNIIKLPKNTKFKLYEKTN